jgi:hypothetical protein
LAYTIGTAHGPFTGTGSFAIAKPVGIRSILTNIPARAGHDEALPHRYFRLGRFSLGNIHGFENSREMEYAQQLVYPILPVWELLAYDIRDGASGTFYELVDVPDLTLKAPWDRTPLTWKQSARVGLAGGSATTTNWTYTVPTGRRLWLAHAHIELQRQTADTTLASSQAWIDINATPILQITVLSNTVGFSQRDELNAGHTILSFGDVIAARTQNGDTGGSLVAALAATGFLFDA